VRCFVQMCANLGAMIGASSVDTEARRGEVGIASAEAKAQDTNFAVTFRSSLEIMEVLSHFSFEADLGYALSL
jgi:hypothetical protein